MPPLQRVYAVCQSEGVAETLAILLESKYEYRAILGEDEAQPLPRPALLIDARAPGRGPRARDRELPAWWPGVQTLRLNLLARTDPAAAQRAVANALRETDAHKHLDDAIRVTVRALHVDLKPRFVATRVILAMAERHIEIRSHGPWRAMCREQLLAITERLDAAFSERAS